MSDAATPPAAPPAKKTFFRALLDFFSPNYVFPQPKSRRVQGGPAQVGLYWDELDKQPLETKKK